MYATRYLTQTKKDRIVEEKRTWASESIFHWNAVKVSSEW